MKEKLTFSQALVMDCIKKFISENGYSPSIRELCKEARLSSPATMLTHLRNLRSKGYIDFVDRKNRTIRILEDNK